MTVAIITDSAAALPAEFVMEHGICVVPMWVIVNGSPFRESEVDIDDVLGAPGSVSTSGPNPVEFETEITRELAGGAEGVVVLTIAANMSSTYQNARTAADEVAGPVRVIDTATAAGAEGLVVLAAARAARSGADLHEVEAVARSVISRVRLVAALPSLEHLVRSGRVPGLAGWAGRQLRITPLFEFRSGDVRRLRPARGMDNALDRMLTLWRRSRPDEGQLHVAALHARSPEAAAHLLGTVENEVAPATSFVGEFGPVMVAHTGPGLVGLAWWWEQA